MFASRSRDAGFTWSLPEATPLPNPDSKVFLLRLGDGSLLCAYNSASVRGKRTNLHLARSVDGGREWEAVAVLEDDKGAEFSYPSVVQVPQANHTKVPDSRTCRVVRQVSCACVGNWCVRR